MDTSDAQKLSERYAHLSDRFRSLWTFYQFLGGVYKHLGEGSLPYTYDFQALYRRLQELVPRMDVETAPDQLLELERVERELAKIHAQLTAIEADFPPSLLRRFFDHLKKQDEKILFALVKFYLLTDQLEQDSLDKLDILLTRLAEAPLEDGRVLQRDPIDMRNTFDRLASFSTRPVVPSAEERPLVDAVREIRREIGEFSDFQTLLNSQVFDRYRRLKQRLGRAFLHPPILVEIIACNIEAKNRFRQLYLEEEVRILEDTNRILEIERYVEKNPDLAHDELRRQLEVFRESRVRFDSGRKEGNLKREDILQMRDAMHRILEEFEGTGTPRRATPAIDPQIGPAPTAPPPLVTPDTRVLVPPLPDPTPAVPVVPTRPPEPAADPAAAAADPTQGPPGPSTEALRTAVESCFPPDPLLNETIHKLLFSLDLVTWDHPPEQAATVKELHYLRLESWEVEAYRNLAEGIFERGTLRWHLQVFFLSSAALRIKIEEEIREIGRLNQAERPELLAEVLERSAQSLEGARAVGQRFQWFIDDALFRGETAGLEHVYRSHFRFLRSYSHLWLDHQASGGLTPL